MDQSLRDQILAALTRRDRQSARSIVREINSTPSTWFTKQEVNSALYTMLNQGEVERLETPKAPVWSLPDRVEEMHSIGSKSPSPNRAAESTDRPKSQGTESDPRLKSSLTRPVEVLLVDNLSPNDPHIVIDVPNRDIVCSVNLNHPYWKRVGLNDTDSSWLPAVESEARLLAYLLIRGDDEATAYVDRVRRHSAHMPTPLERA